jgi:tetratricopeptide (TPR) repeat protein
MVSGNTEEEEVLFRKGSELVKNKQFDEALEIFGSIIFSNPPNEQAWIARGVVLNYQQKYQDAKLAFDQALRINPTNQTAINNRDMVRRHLNPTGTPRGNIQAVPIPASPNKPKPKIQLKKWEKVALLLVCVVTTFIWPNILTQILLPIYFVGIIYIIGWTQDPITSNN